MGLAGEDDGPAVRVEAQHEHSFRITAEGEVLVLVEVRGLAWRRLALHEVHTL